jgi:hypothetical protein
MLSNDLHSRARRTRNYGAWLLCALLLVLCINARLARYEFHQRTLKLATTQSFLDGTETLRKVPTIVPLLLSLPVAITGFPLALLRVGLVMPLVSTAVPFRGFDPERSLRSPPVN